MCRMLAIAPKKGSYVNADLLRGFRELASCGMVKPGVKPGHGDGWGMVTWNGEVPTYLGREPADAWTDPNYEEACHRIAQSRISSPLLVHLRKASVGSKTIENTHPFVIDQWAFAHNGTIRKMNLKGKTDSQWFFESLMHEKELSGGDLFLALKKRIGAVQEAYQYSSLTFLLSNGLDLFAYRDCSGHKEYYTMYFTETSDAIVICQERFFRSNWQEVQNGQLLKVSDDTAEISDFAPRGRMLRN